MLTLEAYQQKVDEIINDGNAMVETLTQKAQESSALKSQLQSIASEVEQTVADKVRELTQQRLTALAGD